MKAFLALAILAATILAGCSGSSGGTVPPMDSQGRYVIHMTAGNLFSPASAKVPMGGTVVWVNDGPANHDVQAKDGSFSSGPAGGVTEGKEFEHKFDTAGSFSYFCHIHDGSGMHATLTVG